MMGKLQKTQNRKSRESSYNFRCSFCMYTSSRRYNVFRHEFRIHSASSKARHCCGLKFETKGEYYVHCEKNHPGSRPANSISRFKYKILPDKLILQSPKKSMETASPKKCSQIRYMLRSRVRPMNYYEDDTEFTLLVSSSPKSELPDEGDIDAQIEGSQELQHSSGYGTNNSISVSFDSAKENNEINLPSSEQLKECEITNHDNLPGDISEKLPEETNSLSPIKFFTNEQTTAGFGESSMIELQKTFNELNVTSCEEKINEKNVKLVETSDLTDLSVCSERMIDPKDTRPVESECIKSSSENEFEKNYCMLSTSTPYNLPPKKRILLRFGFSNRDNIAIKTIDDRLCLPSPLTADNTSLRKKHRLSKKIKCRKLRKRINLSKYSSASSDAENVPPTTADTPKQKIPGLKVDLRAKGTSTWDEITRQMWEHVRSIDFDKF